MMSLNSKNTPSLNPPNEKRFVKETSQRPLKRKTSGCNCGGNKIIKK